MTTEQNDQEKLLEKLRQILALTKSPHEGEAANAAAMLQKFLTAHNLEIADLEDKGRAKAKVGEQKFSLGKAVYVWTWKINLAEMLAKHFYCVALTRYGSNELTFVGRPENVESLKMLFNWLVEQIRRIAAEERKARHQTHIHPMRWQMAFGEGIVPRLGERLDEERERTSREYEGTQALVVRHDIEVNDYLEETRGFRRDGQKTKRQLEVEAEWERVKAEKARLREEDPEAYFKKYPNERPEEIAKQQAQWEKRRNRSYAGYRAAQSRGRSSASYQNDYDREDARAAGRDSADKVNLKPFMGGGTPKEQIQ